MPDFILFILAIILVVVIIVGVVYLFIMMSAINYIHKKKRVLEGMCKILEEHTEHLIYPGAQDVREIYKITNLRIHTYLNEAGI